MTQQKIEKGASVVVAMSGGVDSSVTAGLLKEEGYSVSGMIMRLWGDKSDRANHDKMEEAISDASDMAVLLDIKLHVVDFRKAFKAHVIDYFVSAYENAETPNPCAVCNKYIKFGLLLEEARRIGAKYLATGHYARLEQTDSGIIVRKGVDEKKDQSYFLYRLNQDQLSRLLFPLGGLQKSQVRELADKGGYPVKNRPESQDLCFVSDSGYRDFISVHSDVPFKEGPIVDQSGKQLGSHKGLPCYTIGQRRGIGVAAGEPLYVTGLNRDENSLTVGNKDQRIKHELTAGDVNFISGSPPTEPLEVLLKIRYAAKAVKAVLTPLDDGRIHLKSSVALLDVAPGQSAVFYRENILVGGGTIEPQTL